MRESKKRKNDKKNQMKSQKPLPPKKSDTGSHDLPPPHPPSTRSNDRKTNADHRIVNWTLLSEQLDKCCKCLKGPLNLTYTVGERRAGLAFVSMVKCQFCDDVNIVRTDETHDNTDKKGPKKSKMNEQVVLGTIYSGNGHAQLESLLAPLGVACMDSKTYKSIERDVGRQIEQGVRESCNKWSAVEKSITNSSDLAISYDMGWQKRGKAHNSSTGQGTAVGVNSGKVIDFETRNLSCRICESAQKSGNEAREHDCRKNHRGSSKSMEPEAAIAIYQRAKQNGVRYDVLIGDEDSTTISRIRQITGTSLY